MTMRMTIIAVAMAAGLLAGAAPADAAVTPTRPTATQKAQLQYLVEEEKLARDVYAYFAANVTSQKFSNIVKSEQTHMDNISALLKKYNYFNPTLTRAPGVFRDMDLQALYNELTAQGSAGVVEAFAVGVAIEELDIADIKKMAVSPAPADVKLAWDQLLKGSINHLAAFSR
jgi:hypothetical protein